MTILNSLTTRSRRQSRAFESTADIPRNSEHGILTPAGVRVDEDAALGLSAVWSCARLLSETVGQLPVHTFRKVNDERRPTEPPAWMTQANPELMFQDAMVQAELSLDFVGNAYIALVWSDSAQVLEIWPLDPRRVEVKRDKTTRELVYKYRPDNATAVELSASGPAPDLLHIRGMSWPGSFIGLAPLEHARLTIGTGLAAAEFGARFFGQGMSPPGFVEHPEQLDRKQVREIQRRMQVDHGGLRNAHLAGVLSGGATWKPLSITPEQAQFLETQKFQVDQVARFFGIVPPLVGGSMGDSLTYSNMEWLDIHQQKYAMAPRLKRFEAAFSRFLPGDQQMRFNVDGLLRTDAKTRWRVHESAVKLGVRSRNEVRALEDENPIGPQGDVYLDPAKAKKGSDGDGASAAGTLFRSGYLPDAALEAVGLDPILHTGLLPVTLKTDKPELTEAVNDDSDS